MVFSLPLEEVMKVGDLVAFIEWNKRLDRWFGIVLDVDRLNDQVLVYWSGSATHYEYIDELEVIQ